MKNLKLKINLFAATIILVGGVMLSASPKVHSAVEEWKACCWAGENTCCGDRCEAADGACCANEQCDTPPWTDDDE